MTRLDDLISKAERVADSQGAELSVNEFGELSAQDALRLQDEIRKIPPQRRGKIVTSRGYMLPLSKSKRLNLSNTPVLLVYKDDRAHRVFPHRLGASYVSVEEALAKMSDKGLEDYTGTDGMAERPIARLLWDDPSILEEGLHREGMEVDVGTGRADLILRDSSDRPVVVEIETLATEEAVAQLLRLARGYVSQEPLEETRIRKLLICREYDSNLLASCKESSIELYQLAFRRRL
ncbi:MAG: hypothetical protein ACE5KH_06690 [Candidatus Geothermarchaeales archaeon]